MDQICKANDWKAVIATAAGAVVEVAKSVALPRSPDAPYVVDRTRA